MTDRAAAPASERPLPPLPEPAASYMRGCNIELQPGQLLYTAEQVREVVLADRAASAPQAVRRPLTDEQIRAVVNDDKFWSESKTWITALFRKAESAHGIVPLAPQEEGGKAK